jgi:hypothetical protein
MVESDATLSYNKPHTYNLNVSVKEFKENSEGYANAKALDFAYDSASVIGPCSQLRRI